MREREPKSRETLVFKTPEEAGSFAEKVEKRINREERPGVKRSREIVAEELAGEFSKQDEEASFYVQPWEHTEEEHKEAQELVDLAFLEDLPVALKRARKSSGYPRNIDLLHDVLTGQMYDLMVKRGLNQQSVKKSVTIMLAVLVFVLTMIFLMVITV